MTQPLVTLDGTLNGVLQVVNSSDTPLNSDALPTFQVYGPSGSVETGTCSLLHNGSVTTASNASPIVVASTAHGLNTGQIVTVADCTANTAANGTFIVTRVNANSFSLDGSTGNGSGIDGTWNVAGAYRYSITAMGVDGYEVSENYSVIFSYALSSTNTAQKHTFNVM